MVILAAGVAVAVGVTIPALADSSQALPIKSVGDVVVDGVHQRVFVSDPVGGKVVSATYDGKVIATSEMKRPGALALSTDSKKLYAVSDPDDGGATEVAQVVALDPSTMAGTDVHYTGVIGTPDLAVVAGKLWFAREDGFGAIDPAVPASSAEVKPVDGGIGRQPRLAFSAAAPNLLAVASSTGLTTYDVSGETVRSIATVATTGEIADIKFSPDGETIATVALGESAVTLRNIANLATKKTLAIEANARAVDIALDGTVAGGSAAAGRPDLHIFSASGVKVRPYDLPASDELQPRTVAWEPNGSRLFAVSKSTDGAYTLRTFTEPRKTMPTLAVTGPATAPRAKLLTLTGTLKSTVPLHTGTPVAVTRLDLTKPAGTVLMTRKIDAGGKFTITDTPSTGGAVTYRLTYRGGPNHAAVTLNKVVQVSRVMPVLTLNQHNKIFNQGVTGTFTAHLGSTYTGRTVEIWADPYGTDQAPRLLKRGTVNSKGDLSASVRLTRNTSVTAKFPGDARYATRIVKSVALVRVNLSLTQSNAYRTAKIDGLNYLHYRIKTPAMFFTSLTPSPNRRASLEIQTYTSGAWRYFDSTLVPAGNATNIFDGSDDIGRKLRIRARYDPPSRSGDAFNYPAATPYMYFIFTR